MSDHLSVTDRPRAPRSECCGAQLVWAWPIREQHRGSGRYEIMTSWDDPRVDGCKHPDVRCRRCNSDANPPVTRPAWEGPRRTPSDRLLHRLAAMGVRLRPGSEIHRTRAGRHQRAAGAFAWFVTPDPLGCEVGSRWTVRDLLACDRLMVVETGGSDEVHPWAETTGAPMEPRRRHEEPGP